MSTITPVPTTRVPNSLARERLIRQLEGDQVALLRLQTQITTGRRVLLPSEDASASLRGIAIQQLLERKAQVQVNLSTNQSYLSATDAAISNISNLLASIRGTAIGVSDVGASDAQRRAAAEEVDRALQELVDTGNQKFRGRYLFSGSTTSTQPFASRGRSVEYFGNENRLQSYADAEVLFDTNAHGNAVFGSLSAEVRGTVDLNPDLAEDTLLSDLHGGNGIANGSISISDGVTTSIVDLSGASSIGDVVALLEANPPTGRVVTVSVTATGLNVALDSAGGGDLRIREVGGGTTANDLGILRENGSGVGPAVGTDLNPRLTKTTRIADVFTTFDANSGLRVTSGDETFNINFTTAVTIEGLLNKINGAGAGLVAEINESGTGIDVRSRLSGVNFSIGENGGTTATELGLRTFTGQTRLDELNHGIGVHEFDGVDFRVRRKDGEVFGIDVSGATTIQDILDRINNHADNQDPAHQVTARLAEFGNGIELVTSDTSTIAALAVLKSPLSLAAIDLGLVPTGETESGPPASSGGTDSITGRDVNPTEVGGAFTALVRLSDALTTNDPVQISRAIELLDAASLQLNNTRAEIGARQQGLDTLKSRVDGEVISLKESLSNEVDVDLAQAISDLTARQAAYQATLQTTASISQLSLLDFL